MRKKQQQQLVWVSLAIAAIVIVGFLAFIKSSPGKLDDFARCLEEKGLNFYGAYWCPHCQEQKRQFGNSARLLPYVECSLPGGNGTTIECQQANITSYPTWEFADGSRQTGVITVQKLAELSGCQLPE